MIRRLMVLAVALAVAANCSGGDDKKVSSEDVKGYRAAIEAQQGKLTPARFREALKLGRAELAAVVKALGDESATSKLVFLLRRHGALDGRTPAEAVDEGRLDGVLRLARAWGRS